jgi:hypothetical protein
MIDALVTSLLNEEVAIPTTGRKGLVRAVWVEPDRGVLRCLVQDHDGELAEFDAKNLRVWRQVAS